MSAELDLTFLTPEEVKQIRSVLQRAKEVEAIGANTGKKTESQEVVFRSTWKENHGKKEYVAGYEVVSAALTNGDAEDIREDAKETHETESAQVGEEVEPEENDEEAAAFPVSPDVHEKDDEDNNSGNNVIAIDNDSEAKDQTESKPSEKDAETQVEGKPLDNEPEETEERDVLTPLPEHEPAPQPTKTSDTQSMTSRSSVHDGDYVGEVNVSLTYYPPNEVQIATFPSQGTRYLGNQNLDVLTRKWYAALSGSKISVVPSNKTGAKLEDDGELHVKVNAAYELRLPSGMSRKARTYVKCYLLPDRYHGSKMRSEVIKDSLNPKYDHDFVFRGFSASEFNERGVELVIGGETSAHGRHLVVGGIRLSDGKKNRDGKNVPWKNSNSEEVSLWEDAFNKPSSTATASIALRPQIKLTYK